MFSASSNPTPPGVPSVPPIAPNMSNLLIERNRQIAAIVQTWQALRLTADLDALLTTIVDTAQEALGFGTVVLNMVDPVQHVITVRAHAGLDAAARELLDSAVYPWDTFMQLLDPRFQIGRCYFIPAGSFDWANAFDGPVAISEKDTNAPSTIDPPWDPEDALFVPIDARDGQIVGVLSVDQPRDGCRPTPETRQVLEIFSAQVAIALENAELYAHVQADAARYRAQADELRAAQEAIAQAHRMALRQLATPLIPLTDTMLVLPLIGALDADRMYQMRADLLDGIATHQAQIVLLDVTGVPTVDVEVVTELTRTIQAVQLMGLRVLLTGVRPALAQAFMALQLPLPVVRSYRTLQDGIAVALGSLA